MFHVVMIRDAALVQMGVVSVWALSVMVMMVMSIQLEGHSEHVMDATSGVFIHTYVANSTSERSNWAYYLKQVQL